MLFNWLIFHIHRVLGRVSQIQSYSYETSDDCKSEIFKAECISNAQGIFAHTTPEDDF